MAARLALRLFRRYLSETLTAAVLIGIPVVLIYIASRPRIDREITPENVYCEYGPLGLHHRHKRLPTAGIQCVRDGLPGPALAEITILDDGRHAPVPKWLAKRQREAEEARYSAAAGR